MSWLSRFVRVIRSGRLNRDLDDEMRFHLTRAPRSTRRRACPSRRPGHGLAGSSAARR